MAKDLIRAILGGSDQRDTLGSVNQPQSNDLRLSELLQREQQIKRDIQRPGANIGIFGILNERKLRNAENNRLAAQDQFQQQQRDILLKNLGIGEAGSGLTNAQLQEARLGQFKEGFKSTAPRDRKTFTDAQGRVRFADTPEQLAVPNIQGSKKQIERKEEALASLPQSLSKADAAIATLDELRDHPGLKTSVGVRGPGTALSFAIRGKPPRGSDAAGFQAVLLQVKSQAFINGIKAVKGTGPISDKEGDRIISSITTMTDETSEKEFLATIEKTRDFIEKQKKIMREQAGLPPLERTEPIIIADGVIPENLVVGQIYQNSHGLFKWDGQEMVEVIQ